VLQKIRITNFKVIDDTDLLAVQPFTVFIGRNGSGKSALIESLDWLSHAIEDGVASATAPYQDISYLVHGWNATSQRGFSITLEYDPLDASVGETVVYSLEVGIEPTAEEHLAIPRIVREDLYARTQDGDTRSILTDGTVRQYLVSGQWLSFTNPDRLVLEEGRGRAGDLLARFLRGAVVLRLNPRAIAGFAPARTKPTPRLLDDEGSELAVLLGRLDPEAIQILVEKLSFIVEGASLVDTHKPSGPADRRYFTLVEERSEGPDRQQVTVPAWVLSEGTRRITAILATLLHDSPPPFLCIEEVENGLDPWTLKYLLEELVGAVERGTQVFLTTHSPYLLNLLPIDCIVLCERRHYGIEFTTGDKLPGVDMIQGHMGPGELYTNRYLHQATEDGV
jgi:ABC-type lipoprotein export system ATPase subunit